MTEMISALAWIEGCSIINSVSLYTQEVYWNLRLKGPGRSYGRCLRKLHTSYSLIRNDARLLDRSSPRWSKQDG